MPIPMPWCDPEVVASIVNGTATVLGALIVGGLGAWIGARYTRKRDLQDKESEWRSHAIELTKLDLERKLKSGNFDRGGPLRPTILDFLANYRELQDLGEITPKDLYLKILADRINEPSNPVAPEENGLEPPKEGG